MEETKLQTTLNAIAINNSRVQGILRQTEDLLNQLRENESERKRKDEEISKALLTALFGPFPTGYRDIMPVESNCEYLGYPLDNPLELLNNLQRLRQGETDPA